jgi:hypothetical protein
LGLLLIAPYRRSEEEELQDLGNWEDSLPKEAKDFVVKHDLSKRTVWDFGPTYPLGPDEIKAVCDAVQQGPKQKKLTKVAFNFSSADNRLRTYPFITLHSTSPLLFIEARN